MVELVLTEIITKHQIKIVYDSLLTLNTKIMSLKRKTKILSYNKTKSK